MAITKVVVNDKKEILLNDEWNFVSINVRVATIFREDGIDQSRTFHRYVLMPDADYAALPSDVVQGKLSTVFSRPTNALKEKETWQSQTLGQ